MSVCGRLECKSEGMKRGKAAGKPPGQGKKPKVHTDRMAGNWWDFTPGGAILMDGLKKGQKTLHCGISHVPQQWMGLCGFVFAKQQIFSRQFFD